MVLVGRGSSVWIISQSCSDLLISNSNGFGGCKRWFFGIVLLWLCFGNYGWKEMLGFLKIGVKMCRLGFSQVPGFCVAALLKEFTGISIYLTLLKWKNVFIVD